MRVGGFERTCVLRPSTPIILVLGTMALWTAVGMITTILRTLLRRGTLRVAHRELRRVRRRRAAGEGTESGYGALTEIVGRRVSTTPTPLAARLRHLRHLMGLVEQHLLVGPLRKLGVGWVVVLHLPLLWVTGMSVHGVRLLMGILIELGVKLLRGGRPSGLLLLGRLLLLDGVGVWLLLGHGRLCEGVFVCGRGALAGYRGVDGVGRRRVHGMISRWMPVLRGKNGHGLRVEQNTPRPSCTRETRTR